MMKKIVVILLVILMLGGGLLVATRVMNKDKRDVPASDTIPHTEAPAASNTAGEFSFANPKKGAHFESSTPAHGSTLAAVPVDVAIDFNFDLASNSTIQISKDDKDYGNGAVTVDANKLAMRRKMAPDAPDGLYTVNYNGCWPDRTCHDGHFQFAINRSAANSYQDLRGSKEVTIRLSQLKFQPANIRLSPGTKVTWVNDDDAEHYVNTDSHPAHTHVPSLNSRALAKGASYSYTFTNPGAYPYHCSAHAATMTGNIVVE